MTALAGLPACNSEQISCAEAISAWESVIGLPMLSWMFFRNCASFGSAWRGRGQRRGAHQYHRDG